MNIRKEESDGCLILFISGEKIGHDGKAWLLKEIEEDIFYGGKYYILSLKLKNLFEAGIGCLFTLMSKIHDAEGKMAVVAQSPAVMRLITSAHITGAFDCFSCSLKEAIHKLKTSKLI